MSAQSSITLNTHIYTPAGTSGGVSTWYDKATNGAQAAAKLTESLTGPSSAGMYRARFKLDVPVVASADSACACIGTVLGTAVANVEVAIPAIFSLADRTNLELQVRALIAHAIFESAVKDLEGSW